MILRGQAACDATGISALHSEVFQQTADVTGDVIACRAVGKYATGLIAEGYATKGFHNKAKSCNWGPMAGFVLSDPRFSKSAKLDEQRESVEKAIIAGAIEVPLYISRERLQWLLKESLFKPFFVRAPLLYVGWCHSGNISLQFRLQRTFGQLFRVQYRHAERGDLGIEDGEEWKNVMALRDPLCTVSAQSYLSATTADYDLFAIWAKKSDYARTTYDKRMVDHKQLEVNLRTPGAKSGEHEHLGNLTPRIAVARFMLNEGFRRAGYTGGDMVHHSDEGGRPFVKDIDLPVFAVIPGQTEAYCMSTAADLAKFIRDDMGSRFNAVLSPGWVKQLFHEDLKSELARRGIPFVAQDV